MAPLFNAETINGKKIDLQSLKGQVVVLNMWYTGCLPSLKEMPELNKMVGRFKDQGVAFLAINWDDTAETKKFLEKHSFLFQIIPRRGDIIRKQYMGKHFIFPTTYVIDQKGIIRRGFSGIDKLEEMETLVAGLTKNREQRATKSYPTKGELFK